MALTTKGNQDPGRNEPCPCGSELKFKHCHGDPTKKRICENAVSETMFRLIMQTKFDKGMITEQELRSALNPPEPEEKCGVENLQEAVGLKRCTCGAPIPKKDRLCMKCERKKNES